MVISEAKITGDMAKPGYKEKEPLRPIMKEDLGAVLFFVVLEMVNNSYFSFLKQHPQIKIAPAIAINPKYNSNDNTEIASIIP